VNSDRLLILGIPALVAVLVHLLFVFALEGGWTTASPAITAQPQVVQASLVSLSKPKSKPKPKPHYNEYCTKINLSKFQKHKDYSVKWNYKPEGF